MNAKQYALLEQAIATWIEDAGCDDDWKVIVGDHTVIHMAKAARNVLEACEESQAYGKREGLF